MSRGLALVAVCSVGVLGAVAAWTAIRGPEAPLAPDMPVPVATGGEPSAPAPQRVAMATASAVPESPAEPAPEAPALAPDAAASAPPPDMPEPLRLDVVRVAPDGQMVIAGHAEPGSAVDLLIDGRVAETIEADSRTGAFATVLFDAPSPEARTLRLRGGVLPDAPGVLAAAPSAASPAGAAEPVQTPVVSALAATDTGGALTGRPAPVAGPVPSATSGLAEVVLTGAAEGGTAIALPDVDTVIARAEPQAPVATAAPGAIRKQSPRVEERAVSALTSDDEPVRGTEIAALVTAAPVQGGLPIGEPGPAPVSLETAPQGPVTLASLSEPGSAPVQGRIEAPAPRYVYSAPVVILPGVDAETGPVVLRAEEETIALIQPAPIPHDGVVLDRLTYGQSGKVELAGRARPGNEVRVYVDAIFKASARTQADGIWQANLTRVAAQTGRLLRFDEIATDGAVESRVEAPFAYDPQTPVTVRSRAITVERGDNLWRIAESHYGQGLRYSLIFDANATLIRDPDLIYPGQVFEVPEIVPEN